MYYTATSSDKPYSPATLNNRQQSPASYSSWGTISTPPASVRSSPIYPPSSSSASSIGSPLSKSSGLSVNPLINSNAHISYDIRVPPPQVAQPAFEPSLPKICINVQGQRDLTFNVENPYGVTVQDILLTLYHRLQRPMDRGAVSRLSAEESARAQNCFHLRTSRDPAAYAQGMKVLDRVSGKFRFAGVQPSPTMPGVWEVILV